MQQQQIQVSTYKIHTIITCKIPGVSIKDVQEDILVVYLKHVKIPTDYVSGYILIKIDELL